MKINWKKINWKFVTALLCISLIVVPWSLEIFGINLPRGVKIPSLWLGTLGLIVLLMIVLHRLIESRASR